MGLAATRVPKGMRHYKPNRKVIPKWCLKFSGLNPPPPLDGLYSIFLNKIQNSDKMFTFTTLIKQYCILHPLFPCYWLLDN